MDELLSDFLTETHESLDIVDVELVQFERDPDNAEILANIFRLVHTIKGTCGFLGLPRLGALGHAAESMMARFREGAPVTPEAMLAIMHAIDRIKLILAGIDIEGKEPEGSDRELIARLNELAARASPPPEREERAGQGLAARAPAPEDVEPDELDRLFSEPPGTETEEAGADGTPPNGESPATSGPAGPAGPDREPARTARSIRVNVDTLEHLMTMVGELVLTRNQLLDLVRGSDDSRFTVPLQRLSNVTAELQEGVMKTRMQPIGNAWQKLPRIVRDLARDLGRNIDLDMHGSDTELDRQVLELIRDPLTHMVRNSADHGIEAPDERRARGKSEAGTITLRAFHEGGHVIIEVSDDGKGLAADKIRERAVERGLVSAAVAESMSPVQLQRFIFAPGFSTAEAVTSVSGRGVGMDVVRTNIELIGGSIDVHSQEGVGSTFTIKIPLTLAIIAALIVSSGGQRFAVPQLNVVELVRANSDAAHRIETIDKAPVLRLRNRLLPLVRLSSVLGIEPAAAADAASEPADEIDEQGFIVVTRVGSHEFGIIVDGIFDTEEIVVKPMSSTLRDIAVFSGNTILGDGSVIMIVDPTGIARQVGHETTAAQETADGDLASDGAAAASTALLVFTAGSPVPKAVPLSLVTRLERIECGAAEHANGREMVQYRGHLMPILRFAPAPQDRDGGRQPVLVFSDGDRSVGLAVDEIIDIVEERLDIKVSADEPGRIGSAVVRGRATEIIDVGHYIAQVFDDWLERSRGASSINGRELLLIDDSPFFRDMLVPVLDSAGYHVTAVASAADAMALKRSGRMFDVIVSDIQMPGTDGFQFARQCRADRAWADTPIIALSCYGGREELARGREAGFFDLIGKFDRAGLVRSVGVSLRGLEDAA
jgi:two-component system chemotaxis sensor kinase CheA